MSMENVGNVFNQPLQYCIWLISQENMYNRYVHSNRLEVYRKYLKVQRRLGNMEMNKKS